jgi:Protein of unknown function (DUF2971)
MQPSSDQKRLWEIFHPKAAEEETRILKNDVRFVHYTRAENALQILRDKQLWMRKTKCMADFTEVEHGLNCLLNAYNRTESGKRFQLTLNSIFDGFSKRIEDLFNNWIPAIKFDTFITCFSEHTKKQDTFGRLSMWRAYAANTGVAIVINSSAFQIPANPLKIFLSPVAYLSDADLPPELDRVTNNISTNGDFIKEQGAETSLAYVMRMLRYGSVSIKNPCFLEEKEWRLVYSPSLDPSQFMSMSKSHEPIQGVPQVIYKIPLQGIPGVETSSFIDRIIIGPTQYPEALRETFTDLLKGLGVDKPNVYPSNIPLRT